MTLAALAADINIRAAAAQPCLANKYMLCDANTKVCTLHETPLDGSWSFSK